MPGVLQVEHTVLVTSLLRSDVMVPDNLVAETPALRKKYSKIRGTAGTRKARLNRENAKQKKASTSNLGYVTVPVPPVPDWPASPPPSRPLNQPSPNLPTSSDEEENLDPCFKFVTADSLARQAGTAPRASERPNAASRSASQSIEAPSDKKV